jgi:hypothetical protein
MFEYFILSEVLFPRLDTIGWFFVLEPPKDCLVLSCYFHESLLSCISIETRNFESFCSELTRLVLTRVVKFRLVVLHDIGHLVQQNFVFSFNVSILP